MKPKECDAVMLMRELRDRLSEKYAAMSIEEEMADLQQHVAHVLRKPSENGSLPASVNRSRLNTPRVSA